MAVGYMTSLLNEHMNKFDICKRHLGVVRNVVTQAIGSHDQLQKVKRNYKSLLLSDLFTNKHQQLIVTISMKSLDQ